MAEAWRKKLSMASKTWGNARKRATEEGVGYSSDVEDGRYLAALSEAVIGESQSSGRLQIAWTYTILEGESQGQTVRDYDGLETEENQMWLARKLSRLGYEVPDDLEEIEKILKEVTRKKPHVRIRVKTKGEYQNVYIDKRVGEGEEDGQGAASEEVQEESEEAGEASESGGEGEVELTIGMTVSATLSSGDGVEGEVVKIEEEEGKALIRTSKGKLYRLGIEKLEISQNGSSEEAQEEKPIEEDEEVPEEPRAKVVKKSPAKKPAPKKKGKR